MNSQTQRVLQSSNVIKINICNIYLQEVAEMKTVRLVLMIICFLSIYSLPLRNAGAQTTADDYYCFLFIVDALEPALLKEMMNEGRLPNIKKYIYDNGLWVDHSLSVFPSVSAPAISTIITGNFPGTHEMVGFQWFNRRTGAFKSYIGTDILDFDADLRENSQTIFDFFDKSDTASFAVIAGPELGVNKSLVSSSLNPFHRWEPMLHISYVDLLGSLGIGAGIPHFMALYEWRFEYDAYQLGTDDPDARRIIEEFDEQLGNIAGQLASKGILDKTYFVLCSDHGFPPSTKNFYIDQDLASLGFRKKLISYNLGTFYFPLTLERWDSFFSVSADLRQYNLIVGSNAGGFAQLYFVKNGGYNRAGKYDKDLWFREVVYDDLLNMYLGKDKGNVNVAEYLKNLEGIDFFVVRERYFDPPAECRVRVVSKRGMAIVSRRGAHPHDQEYRYEVVEGEDPFRYDANPKTKKLMDGSFHSGKAWQMASYDYDYPDACVQLVQVFDTTRSGSVILSCKEEWSMNSLLVCKHGGYMPVEMQTALCISGPGIERQSIPTARLADITPSILYLLNKEFEPRQFDGEVIPALKEAVMKRGQTEQAVVQQYEK